MKAQMFLVLLFGKLPHVQRVWPIGSSQQQCAGA